MTEKKTTILIIDDGSEAPKEAARLLARTCLYNVSLVTSDRIVDTDKASVIVLDKLDGLTSFYMEKG